MSDEQDQSRIQIDLPMDAIKAFCERWHITELRCSGRCCATISGRTAILTCW